MKKTTCIALAFALLMVFAGVSPALAATSLPRVDCLPPLTPATAEVQAEEPLFLAAGGEKGRNASPNTISPIEGPFSAPCEWFYIDCIEEEDDVCCGSESSCTSYCEEICNGPCGPAAN